MSSRKFAPFYLLTALKKEVIYNQIFFFTYQLGGGGYIKLLPKILIIKN